MKITNNTYVIQGLFTLSPWVVNSGFIVGSDKTLIIDSGANRQSAQTILGYAECAGNENEILAVNTEPHFDHFGGNCYLNENGVKLFAHEGINRKDDEYESLKYDFNETITHPVRKKLEEENLLLRDSYIVNPENKIRENIRIDLGTLSADILLTPGHTPYNISVFCSEEGVLFSGDTVVEGYVPNMDDSDIEGWKDWLDSLDIIEGLNPKYIIPGHGKVISGENIWSELERMRKFLNEGIRTGKSPTFFD